MKNVRSVLAIAVLVTWTQVAMGQVPDDLKDVARMAVMTNPDVQSRWHDFRAAQYEQDSIRAGYRPKLDVEVAVGRGRTRTEDNRFRSSDRFGAEITLTQLIYDGGFTPSEVSRFGHVRMVRYYELLDEIEGAALESVRAYADVLRFRDLVTFAQENYVEHKLVYDQIVERTRSGVGRGVDLELATGRLALAESNLLTEVANLHDVSARFLRIVGDRVPEQLAGLSYQMMQEALPPVLLEALGNAYLRNPTIKATVANVMAGQDLVASRRAPFRPRLDVRARQVYDRLDGDGGIREREGVVELILNYNFYRGGGDQARLRQAAESLNSARDTRERVCRDVRQTVTIAYNEVQTIDEQLRYLDQHQLSTAKAREAYRQQFDIGQRTLLDLLDGENEYFDARRAYTNAEYNQIIAQARTLAGMGELLKALDVVREELPSEPDLAGEDAYVDAESICPPLFTEMMQVDKEAILSEALRTVGARP